MKISWTCLLVTSAFLPVAAACASSASSPEGGSALPADASASDSAVDSGGADHTVPGTDALAPNDAAGPSDASAPSEAQTPFDTGAPTSLYDGPVDDGSIPPNAMIGSCDPAGWTATALYSQVGLDPEGGTIVITPPSYAIDGLQPSRWTSGTAQSNSQWYELDFGGYVLVSNVTIDNHYFSVGDLPSAFDIAAAHDGVNFGDYRSLVDGGVSLPPDAGPLLSVDFPQQATRFLRIQTDPSDLSGSWWSMEELRVACQVPDAGMAPADAGFPRVISDSGGVPPTTVPANPNRANWHAVGWPSMSPNAADQVFSNAIDDLPDGGGPNLATRWANGIAMSGDEYFVLDLGQAFTVSWITLVSGSGNSTIPDSARAWEVQFSTDGVTWTAGPQGQPPGPEGVNGDTNATAGAVTQLQFVPTSARYIRINQLGASGSWWSIYDMTVYGQ